MAEENKHRDDDDADADNAGNINDASAIMSHDTSSMPKNFATDSEDVKNSVVAAALVHHDTMLEQCRPQTCVVSSSMGATMTTSNEASSLITSLAM